MHPARLSGPEWVGALLSPNAIQAVLVAAVAALIAGRAWYQLRARAEPIDRASRDTVSSVIAVLSSSLFVLVVLLLAIDPGLLPIGLASASPLLGAALQGAGLAGLLIALGLFFSAHHALGTQWTLLVAVKAQHRLVDRGPYRRIRHPLYTSFVLAELSVLGVVQSWAALIPLLFSIPGFLIMARAEERLLADRLGPSYREYLRRTGAFLPRLRPP